MCTSKRFQGQKRIKGVMHDRGVGFGYCRGWSMIALIGGISDLE